MWEWRTCSNAVLRVPPSCVVSLKPFGLRKIVLVVVCGSIVCKSISSPWGSLSCFGAGVLGGVGGFGVVVIQSFESYCQYLNHCEYE